MRVTSSSIYFILLITIAIAMVFLFPLFFILLSYHHYYILIAGVCSHNAMAPMVDLTYIVV